MEPGSSKPKFSYYRGLDAGGNNMCKRYQDKNDGCGTRIMVAYYKGDTTTDEERESYVRRCKNGGVNHTVYTRPTSHPGPATLKTHANLELALLAIVEARGKLTTAEARRSSTGRRRLATHTEKLHARFEKQGLVFDQ